MGILFCGVTLPQTFIKKVWGFFCGRKPHTRAIPLSAGCLAASITKL